MTERRWVVDTNVLLSRLLCPGGVAAQAVDRALGSGVLLVSDDSLSELIEVLDRSKFDRYLSRDDRRRFVELLGGVARLIPIARQVQGCRDPRDDKFVDVAVNGEGAAILTGDRDLLELDPFHGVRILNPPAFLTWD